MLVDWKSSVLQPILQFRDAQERIQRRVRDDLRTSVEDYDEMLNVTLPRIRRNYERRCEDHLLFLQQQRAIEEQRQLLSTISLSEPRTPTETETPGMERHATGSPGHVSPQPDMGASRSNFLDTLRKKEGWDAAPKRLNALISRMLDGTEREGTQEMFNVAQTMDAPTSTKSHQVLAVKQAKAKREMEEADRAYRKAIFDLETLRIRRDKTLAAAVKSILEWRRELSITMQQVSLQHVRAGMMIRTSIETAHKQDEQLALRMLDHLDEEQRLCEDWLPTPRMLAQNERVKYVNYFHGPYNDLIFGTGLVDYAFSHGDQNLPSQMTESGHIAPAVRPPLILTKCIQFMEQPRCMQYPGIYRLSAKYSRVQEITSMIEQDESSFQFDADREDPTLVASVLKQYLRALPEPVMALRWEERMRYTHDREEHIRNGFANFKSRIRRMPPIHQATLRALLMHLALVAQHSDKNKMTTANLAVVFSPVILSEPDHDTASLAAASEEDCTLADLIEHCADIFAVPERQDSPIPPPKEDLRQLKAATMRDVVAKIRSGQNAHGFGETEYA